MNDFSLSNELGAKLATCYKEQIYDEDGVGCGAGYLSSLVWDMWCGLPANPYDPTPYICSILPTEIHQKVMLCEDKWISCLTKVSQDALYCESVDKMWEIVKSEIAAG